MFGLVHCADAVCAMSLSTGVRQIDRKEAAFCAPCRTRLAAARPLRESGAPREANPREVNL